MKKTFLALLQMDALAEGGGATGVITKAIDESFNKFKGEVDGVKTSLNAAKDELKNEVSSAKATAQKALEQVEEAIKTLASVKSMGTQPTQVKSFETALKEAIEEKSDNIERFARGEIKSLSLEVKGFDQKAVADTSTANVTGSTVYGAVYRPGFILNPNQIGHMRTAIPVAPAGPGTDYYFMRENGVGEGAPAPTAEKKAAAATNAATGLFPQFDVDTVESSVKFETIGGFLTLSKKALKNVPGLISFLQSRVPEKLLDVEDAQILYGDGTSPNLKGILTSGNFVAGSAAGTTPLVEKIINDISTLEDGNKRVASMICMRPADYWTLFKAKASGSGEYDLPAGVAFVNGVLYIAGVPVMKSTALTTNDYCVCAAGGAELEIQESISLEFFEQDSTNVRTRQTTLLVQETVALPVFGSNYFIKGSSALA